MEIKHRRLHKYKFQLLQNFQYQTGILGYDGYDPDGFVSINPDGLLMFKIYYAWDGSTFSPDVKSNFLAALLHDGCFQLLRNCIIPLSELPAVDRLYYTTCLAEGMNKIIANLYYAGIRTPIAHSNARSKC